MVVTNGKSRWHGGFPALSRYPSLGIELVTFLAQLELEDIIPAHYAERLACGDFLTA